MKFCVLGSGSNGNSIAVWGEGWGALIDAGLSRKQIILRSEARGVPIRDIHTLLITHRHGDHTTSIRTLVEREGFDSVWVTQKTMDHDKMEYLQLHPGLCKVITPRVRYRLGPAAIVAVETRHATDGAVTYFIKEGERKLAMFFETTVVTPEMWAVAKGAQAYIVEANHDPYMLADCDRPKHINERTGLTHLSNGQAAEVVEKAGPEAELMVFVHLSSENNDPELLKTVLRKAAAKRPRAVAMRLSTQEQATEVLTV